MDKHRVLFRQMNRYHTNEVHLPIGPTIDLPTEQKIPSTPTTHIMPKLVQNWNRTGTIYWFNGLGQKLLQAHIILWGYCL